MQCYPVPYHFLSTLRPNT